MTRAIKRFKWDMLAISALLFAISFGFTGCATMPLPDSKTPVCEALVGPIKYNSTDPRSQRHAGPALAPDLAQRNRVGINLKCPQYRR